MSTESFIAIEHTPTDVKSAIEMLSVIIQQQNDKELLLKMGAVQGVYAVYERTGDVSILEHLIIDIIMLFKNTMSVNAEIPPLSYHDMFSERRTDLIYIQTSDTNESIVLAEELIEEFLDKLQSERTGFSKNTRTTYASSLRRVIKDMDTVPLNSFGELAHKIEESINNHPGYNHNIKSAANGFIKYLLEL